MGLRPEIRNVYIAIAINLVLSLFLTINYDIGVGIVYTAMSIVSGAIYFISLNILKRRGIQPIGLEFGRGTDWFLDALVGLGVAVFFILGFAVDNSFSMGLPQVPLSIGTGLIFIVRFFLAPTAEGILFRGAILTLAQVLRIPFFITVIVQAVAFSLFHLTAYGDSITSAGGAFLAAVIFGIVIGLVTKWRRNVLVEFVSHAPINIALTIANLAVAAVAG